MATKRWIGNAANVAQVDKVTFAGVFADTNTITTTINGKAHVVTVGSAVTDATTAAAAYKKAINGTAPSANEFTVNFDAAAHGEFAEITASLDPDDSLIVWLTGDTAGKPFTVTSVVNTAAGTTVLASLITATGENYLTDVDNWDGGAIPVDDDDIIFDRGSTSMLYGLSQSAVTLTSLTIRSEYTGKIGLARVNADDSALPYNEYRTRAWTTGAAADANDIVVKIGEGDGVHSGRIVLNFNDSDYTATVYGTGTRTESSVPVVQFIGSATTPEITVVSGDVGLGMEGATTVLTKLHLLSSAAQATLGANVTWTSGGELLNQGGTLIGTVTIP